MKFPFLLSCRGSPVASGQEGCTPGWALQGSAKPQEVSVVCQHPSLLQQLAFISSVPCTFITCPDLRKTRNNCSPLWDLCLVLFVSVCFCLDWGVEWRDASFLLFILHFAFQLPDLGSACPCVCRCLCGALQSASLQPYLCVEKLLG